MLGRVLRSIPAPGVAAEDKALTYVPWDGGRWCVGRIGKFVQNHFIEPGTLRDVREVTSGALPVAPWLGPEDFVVTNPFGIMAASTVGAPFVVRQLTAVNDVSALAPRYDSYLCVKSGWSFFHMTAADPFWALHPLGTFAPPGLGTPAGMAALPSGYIAVAANSSSAGGYGLRVLDPAASFAVVDSAALPASDPILALGYCPAGVLGLRAEWRDGYAI